MHDQKKHIEKIRLDFKNGSDRLKESSLNAIKKLADDLYTKSTHFILELIQNAEDNKYGDNIKPALSFYLTHSDPTNTSNSSGALIIQNNEIGFLPENIDAICAVGKTTKIKEQGYIGEKGIGFKSVFKISSNPYIISKDYCFYLPEKDVETKLGYIVPCWWENPSESLLMDSGTTIILPLDKSDYPYQKLETMLCDIDPVTILFISKIRKIDIKTDSGADFSIQKDDSKFPQVQMKILDRKKSEKVSVVYEFIVSKKNFDRPNEINQEQREEILSREIFVVFPKIVSKKFLGKIFAYLPLDSRNSGFPFLINADFILDSARGNLKDECKWNDWLSECIAQLVSESFVLLEQYKLLTAAFLDQLSIRLNEIEIDDFFYPIAERIKNVLTNEDHLPADDGNRISGKKAKLVRSNDMVKLIDTQDLTKLYGSTYQWLSTDITTDKTPNLKAYLTKKLGVQEVSPDVLCRLITDKPNFLHGKISNTGWFIDFYLFIADRPSLIKECYLRTKSIVLLENNTIVPAFENDSKTPRVYLPLRNKTNYPVIKNSLLEDHKEVYDFFHNQLGINKPDICDDVIHNVLTKYKTAKKIIVSNDEYEQDLNKIGLAMQTDSESKKRHILEEAKQSHFIRAINNNNEVDYKDPDHVYFDLPDLRTYFSNTKQVWFIDKICEKIISKEILERFGIRSLPKRISIITDYTSDVYRKEGTEDYELDGLTDFLSMLCNLMTFEEKKENALLLWKILKQEFKNNEHFFYADKYWFYYSQHHERTTSILMKHLKDNKWIPTKNNTLESPEDIIQNLLIDEIVQDTDLIKALNIPEKDVASIEKEQKMEYADKLGIKLEDVELIRNNPSEFERFKESMNKSKQPNFPNRPVPDPDRRRDGMSLKIANAEEKLYETRQRRIRVSSSSSNGEKTYLEYHYTNDNIMYCQICKNEMPFKKRNGDYYYESVEVLTGKYLPKENKEQYLALCPECSARYNEYVLHNDSVMAGLKDYIINGTGEMNLNLGDISENNHEPFVTNIYFEEAHLIDLQEILKAENGGK